MFRRNQKESNPQPRIWNPGCYHYTMILCVPSQGLEPQPTDSESVVLADYTNWDQAPGAGIEPALTTDSKSALLPPMDNPDHWTR